MSVARWGWNNGELAPQISGPWVGYADHVAALAEVRQPGRVRLAIEDARAEALREARDAIPANDHRTDLDINDYDTATEYGLAIARAAIDALTERQAPEPLGEEASDD